MSYGRMADIDVGDDEPAMAEAAEGGPHEEGRSHERGGRERSRPDRGGRDRGPERGGPDRGGPERGGPRGRFRGPPRGGRPRIKPPIQEVFRRGDEVLVQVIKEGIGTKGPTLSTYISIP